MDISSLDVRQLVAEFQVFVGAFFDNIYQYARQDLVFQLRKGKLFYLRVMAHVIWLASKKGVAPEKVGGFCAQLRKLLNNLRIEAVEQVGSERIILIKTKPYDIFIELFGKGNVVVVDSGKIVAAQFSLKFHDREIQVHSAYSAPKKQNLFELSAFPVSSEPISKALATLGLGRMYAEELCFRAGIPSGTLNVESSELMVLFKKLLVEVAPVVCDGVVSLFLLSKFNGRQVVSFGSLSEAIDSVSSVFKPEIVVDKSAEKNSKAVMLQEKHIEELLNESLECQKKAELLYENYQKVSLLLQELRNYYKTAHWKEVVENSKPLLRSLNEKNRQVVISL